MVDTSTAERPAEKYRSCDVGYGILQTTSHRCPGKHRDSKTMMQRLRKIIRTAFTPLPTFTIGDSLHPDFQFKDLWKEHRRITSARLQLLMLLFGAFCLMTMIVVIL